LPLRKAKYADQTLLDSLIPDIIIFFFFSRLQQTQKELREATAELKTLRETYNSKQDAWIKEKLQMQVD
jgi:hypothetical protein